ncbi:hypothetical protein D7W81_00125 [Corallococcus aberystwythensis]|uniref:Uncharacterized protein n=1 Tax=Corallococcus aberystwythensis TaxID=2316722 RepID=A0A3A8R157_9BACT|nr:hypothetical protein D7W81_00125 [Corallococcus aberystwythensis]
MTTSRFVLALAVSALLPAVLIALAAGAYSSWPGFSPAVFGLVMFSVTCATFPIALVMLILRTEAPNSTYLKEPLQHVELTGDGVKVLDATGALLGDSSRGTLRVARTNMWHGKTLAGAVVLEYAAGATCLMGHVLIGAWPGLKAIQGARYEHRIDDSLMDELLRRAE